VKRIVVALSIQQGLHGPFIEFDCRQGKRESLDLFLACGAVWTTFSERDSAPFGDELRPPQGVGDGFSQ